MKWMIASDLHGSAFYCKKKPPIKGASQTVAMFSLVISGVNDKYLHWRAYFRYYRVPW